MKVAHAFARSAVAEDSRARSDWLARFGAAPPTCALTLAKHVTAYADGEPTFDAARREAQSLGVLRAHQGHVVAGLVEDLTALRRLVGPTPETLLLVDAIVAAATAAYVEEMGAILEARATRDPLTGLPNRAAFTETMRHEIRAQSRTAPPALLLVDLDGFKSVNDTDGHLAGDAVLTGVAAVLSEHVRAGDLACRLGGDEFAVLLPRTSAAQALKVARRVLSAARRDDRLASPSARVRLSVGVGWLPSPADVDDLVAVADSAMYAAKAAGGDAVLVGRPPSTAVA